MQAKRGFFSAIFITALVVGGSVYFWQANKIWFLEKRIAQIEADRPRIGSAVGAYRLNSEQWAKFVEVAKVPPGRTYRVFITYNGSCEDCAIFAQNLLNRLALIPGWESNAGAGMPDPLQKGLLVRVHSKSLVSDEAKAITHALQATGLNALIHEEPILGKDAAPDLLIGIPQ